MTTVTIHRLVVVMCVMGVTCGQPEDYSECCSLTARNDDYPCMSVTRTNYCVPSIEDSAQVGLHPMEYLNRTFYQNMSGQNGTGDQKLNISWSQSVPVTSAIQGYIIQLKGYVTGNQLCYLVALDKSVPTGQQVVRAGCLKSIQRTEPICITVFAVSANSDVFAETKSQDLKSAYPFDTSWKNCAIQSVYHSQRDVLKVSFNRRPSFHNSLLLCDRSSNRKSYDNQKVRCFDLDNTAASQSELYAALSPLSGDYYLEMSFVPCRYANCYEPRGSCEAEVNFTRSENFSIPIGNCIYQDYSKWIKPFVFEPVPNGLSFHPSPSYLYNDSCKLKKFQVNLYRVKGAQNCNVTPPDKQHEFGTHVYHTAISVMFRNLKPGNYCVRVKPQDSLCGQYECVAYASPVKEVFEHLPDDQPVLPTIPGPPSHISYTELICVIVAVICGTCVASAIFVVWRIRCSGNLSTRGHIEGAPAREIPPYEIMKRVKEAQHKPRVLLLYCKEDDRLSRVINTFAKVLESCFHLQVFLPNSIESICQRTTCGEGEWVIDTIEESDKIIFVSSVCALKKAQGGFEQDSVDEELNLLFRSFFHNIVNNIQLHFNYDRLYVVRFSFTPSEYVFDKVVPNRHYVIPSSLPSLFMVMHSKVLGDNRFCDNSKLDKYWRNSTEYTTLLSEICAEHIRLNSSSIPEPLLRHSRSDTSFGPNKMCTTEQCCALLLGDTDHNDHLSLKNLHVELNDTITVLKDDSKSSVSSTDSGYQNSVSSSGNANSHC